MSLPNTLAASARSGARPSASPFATGLPDPRPLTGYTASYREEAGVGYIDITLDGPCIIRGPAWLAQDCLTGETITPEKVGILGPDRFYLQFVATLAPSVNLVVVPYQDMEVQNFHGGFVTPGAKWFRAPV